MLARLRAHLSYANVVATIALFVALSTGGAYATHLVVNSSDVVDESLTGADVKGKAGTITAPSVNGSLTTHDIAGQPANMANGSPFIQGSLTTWDIADATVRSADVSDNSLAAGDLAPSSVNTSEVADNEIRSEDVRNDNLMGGGLTSADLGEDSVGPSEFQFGVLASHTRPWSASTLDNSTSVKELQVSCPLAANREEVTGGGFVIAGPGGENVPSVVVQRSYAVDQSTWLVRAVATSGSPTWHLTVIANCAQ
jgi:hypothetical protein